MKRKVFLSHSSRDKDFVRDLDKALKAYGVETFLDERDIAVGEDIPERIYQAIEDATHVCYILSQNSIDSAWVKEELSAAKMREKERGGVFILPVLLDDVPIPTSVRSKRYADFRNRHASRLDQHASFALLLKAMGLADLPAPTAEAPKPLPPQERSVVNELTLLTVELQDILDTIEDLVSVRGDVVPEPQLVASVLNEHLRPPNPVCFFCDVLDRTRALRLAPGEKERVERLIREILECADALTAFRRKIEMVAHGNESGADRESVHSLMVEQRSNVIRFKNKSRMLLFSVVYFADPGVHPRDRLASGGAK